MDGYIVSPRDKCRPASVRQASRGVCCDQEDDVPRCVRRRPDGPRAGAVRQRAGHLRHHCRHHHGLERRRPARCHRHRAERRHRLQPHRADQRGRRLPAGVPARSASTASRWCCPASRPSPGAASSSTSTTPSRWTWRSRSAASPRSITVEGEAPVVNTATADISKTVEAKAIESLPIVDRNVYSLLDITPGVQSNNNGVASASTGTSNLTLGFPEQRTLINGGADGGTGSVNYYLDGGINMTALRNTGNILPNPDAIQEFKVQTNSYNVEYGRFASGIINVITKSGTNRYQRLGVRVHARRRPERQGVGLDAGAPAAQAEPVRRHPRRPARQGPDVLLRQLLGAAPDDADVPEQRDRRRPRSSAPATSASRGRSRPTRPPASPSPATAWWASSARTASTRCR